MPSLPLIGPSYQLRNGKAEVRRLVNWMSVQIESGTGKGGAVGYLKQVPGLRLLGNFGAECRGLFVARDVLYGVFGGKLKSITSAWAGTDRGSLGSVSGRVNLASNNTQLAVIDDALGYNYDLDTTLFSTITSNWRAATGLDFLDGYGTLSFAGSNQFGVTNNQDFATIDPLKFASAEGSNGDIVGHIVNRRELYLFKTNNIELWIDSGGADFPLSRNDSANIEVGCSARHSVAKAGGSVFWLGRDERGAAVVFAMAGYQPQRISSHALEEQIGALSDLSQASAFTYHQEGLTFYVMQVPGLATTWVYELSAGLWHERAAFVDGEFAPWPAVCHAYVYGLHVVGDENGNLYALDPLVNTIGSGPLVRDFVSPHSALPSLQRRRYGSIQLDGQTGLGLADGTAGRLMLRYSSTGGKGWSNWRYLSLGAVGQYAARARATMLGSDRDRCWEIRLTDDVTFEPVSIVVDEV